MFFFIFKKFFGCDMSPCDYPAVSCWYLETATRHFVSLIGGLPGEPVTVFSFGNSGKQQGTQRPLQTDRIVGRSKDHLKPRWSWKWYLSRIMCSWCCWTENAALLHVSYFLRSHLIPVNCSYCSILQPWWHDEHSKSHGKPWRRYVCEDYPGLNSKYSVYACLP